MDGTTKTSYYQLYRDGVPLAVWIERSSDGDGWLWVTRSTWGGGYPTPAEAAYAWARCMGTTFDTVGEVAF